MKKAIKVIVFVFVAAYGCEAQEMDNEPKKWFELTKIPDKAEYVQSLSAHGTGINYGDVSHQFGKVALSADIYGFHHGTVGSASLTVPFRIKNLTLAPGGLFVFGLYETGPGFGLRWNYCQGIFCTEGTAGWFHPVTDGRQLQFLGDPIDADVFLFRWTKNAWLKEMKTGYSGEFGRYGKFGQERDRFHGGQAKLTSKHPVSRWISRLLRRETEPILGYVPDGKILRVGVSVNPTSHYEADKH